MDTAQNAYVSMETVENAEDETEKTTGTKRTGMGSKADGRLSSWAMGNGPQHE